MTVPPLRYVLAVTGLAIAFLAAFAVVTALRVPLLDDPGPWLAGGGTAAAAVGVGLLVADVVLPVPSSLVMIAHGALFGAVLGTALSTAGAVGAAALGYGLGRGCASPLLDRVCPPAQRARAARFVGRWGVLAVVATRPVPLLAETVAVVAGAERLGIVRTVLAALAGSLPAAALYAAAGAAGVAGPAGIVALVAALAVAALVALAGRRIAVTAPSA